MLDMKKSPINYLDEIDLPDQFTCKYKSNKSTVITFIPENKKIIIPALTHYFLFYTKYVDENFEKVDKLYYLDADEPFDMVMFKTKIIMNDQGIYIVSTSNQSYASDLLASAVTSIYDIISTIFIYPTLTSIHRFPSKFIFYTPHTYLIVSSIKDIIEEYGIIDQQQYAYRIYKAIENYKKRKDLADDHTLLQNIEDIIIDL